MPKDTGLHKSIVVLSTCIVYGLAQAEYGKVTRLSNLHPSHKASTLCLVWFVIFVKRMGNSISTNLVFTLVKHAWYLQFSWLRCSYVVTLVKGSHLSIVHVFFVRQAFDRWIWNLPRRNINEVPQIRPDIRDQHWSVETGKTCYTTWAKQRKRVDMNWHGNFLGMTFSSLVICTFVWARVLVLSLYSQSYVFFCSTLHWTLKLSLC